MLSVPLFAMDLVLNVTVFSCIVLENHYTKVNVTFVCNFVNNFYQDSLYRIQSTERMRCAVDTLNLGK